VNALRRIQQALVRKGVVLDLQPKLANAPVLGAEGVVLGRLDETEFRAYADKVNRALEETISAGLFADDGELELEVVHRLDSAAELLEEVETWTGTTVPTALRRRLKRSTPPFDVQEGARLRRLRVL
jgi:hypothetical protein